MLRQRFAGRPRSAPAAAPDLGAPPGAVQGDYEIYAVVCHSGNLQARPNIALFADLTCTSEPDAFFHFLCNIKRSTVGT